MRGNRYNNEGVCVVCCEFRCECSEDDISAMEEEGICPVCCEFRCECSEDDEDEDE